MKKVYIFSTGELRSHSERYTEISAAEALNIINSRLIIIIDNKNKIENNELFKILYKAASKDNMIYLIGANLDSAYAKNVFSLAIAKSIYNLYKVDSMEVIDNEYLEYVLGKQNTIQDIENYIGSDVAFSETIGPMLLEILNMSKSGEDERLLQYIRTNADTLRSSAYYNEAMRSLNDKLAHEIEDGRKKIEDMSDEYEQMRRENVVSYVNIERITHS